MSDPHPPETIADLTGWKEVAAYLSRSVRSVQRWERELGLQVHRIRTQAGEVIYARRVELDRWLESRQGDGATGPELNGESGDARNGTGAPDSAEPLTAPQTAGGVRRSRLSARALRTGGLLLLMAAAGGFEVTAIKFFQHPSWIFKIPVIEES